MFKQIHKNAKNKKAQTIMEFTFSMIMVMIMFYGAIQIFRWSGLDLARRRDSHDKALTQSVEEDWGCKALFFCTNKVVTDGPIKQLDPYFYKPAKMNAVWGGY